MHVTRFNPLLMFALPFLSLLHPCTKDTATANEAIVDAANFPDLQTAADALPSSGGILRIGPGRYELTQPLRIKTGETTVEGVGAATHLINKNEAGQPTILIENSDFADKATPRDQRLWRVRLANLRLTGNPQSGSGIEARYIEEIFVQGVTISEHGRHGLHLHACYEDPRINDNLFTYNKDCGVYLDECHDIVVSANHFEENQTGLKCVDSFNLAMSGNNLDDHLGDGVVIENTYGSVVASNMIEECQGWAIVLDRDVYGTTISANVIAHEFTGGVDVRDAHGCAISANTFTIVKNIGLAVRSQSGSITITGNNFSDSWVGSEKQTEISKRPLAASNSESNPNEAAGILLESCDTVAIVGNVFSRLTTADIDQRGACKNINVEANARHPLRK